MRKDKYISEPGENIPIQTRLNSAPGFRQTNLQVFPRVEASRDALDAILATGGLKGNDWEFRPDYTPTIVSVTSLDRVFSAPWDNSLRERLRQPFLDGVAPDGTRYHWVAHSTVGADKAVVDKVYNATTSLDDWSDSMLSHYLANQHLVKAPDKDESDDSGSLGFMDLWTTASLVTDFSNHKTCRGAICPGSDPGTWGYSLLAPCPTHSPMSYCGIDGFVSPVAHVHNMEILRKHRMSERFYRDLMKLSELCWKMEKNGIKIDRAHVEKTNEMMDAKKNALFSYTLDRRGKPVYAEFNPKSAPQVLKFFREAGIQLKKTDRDAIAEAVEENLRLAGYGDGWKGYEEDPDREISPALQRLIDLKVFKTEGKGLDPWFGEKYLQSDDLVHPRFVVTGTSTGRLSSSKPNFQNIPRRGVFGEEVRKAVVPYTPDFDLTKSDFSQLEFRIVLYLAGEPYNGKDVFTWMVEQTGDALFNVAKDFDPIKYEKNPAAAARDITKSVAHGCVTGDHEVLTPSGWVRIDEWAGEKIAQWSKDGNIHFDEPSVYHDYPETPVCKITGPAFSQIATYNHRFPVATRGTSDGKSYTCWSDMTPATWEGRNTGHLPVAGLHHGAEMYSDLELQQAIAIQADGSAAGPGRWRFHVKKPRKIERLELLFGAAPELRPDGAYTLTAAYDNQKLLTAEKKLGWGFLNTSVRQKKLCLYESTLWDGSRHGAYQRYNNTCRQSLDVLQTLRHLSGGQSKVNCSGPGGFEGSVKPVYRMSYNERSYATKSLLKLEDCGEQRVYCFTTNTGYFLVRRNGHISVTGNSNYGEGLVLLDPKEMTTSSIKSQINNGALAVYPDWTFHGKIVAFTGANLAERLFRNRTHASRKRALEIQEGVYFKRFEVIRKWQKQVLDFVQENGYVQSPTGRFLKLYGTPDEIAKVAIAFLGQGVGADHVQGIMLRFYEEQSRVPLLQVHDELIFQQPKSLTNDAVVEYIRLMEGETWRLPGFTCPIEAKRGNNWKEMTTIWKG